MNSKSKLWLALIFLSVVILRLIIAFQTEGLDYEAYSVLRQVESIHETGLPIFDDELSYSGRSQIFSPVYHYFLASFTFVMPLEIVAKVIPNILASLMVVIVFFFALYFIKDEKPALIIALLSGVIPVFFDSTINSASIYTAVIPVFFMTAYFFVLTYKDNKHIWSLLFSMVLLTFIHPSSLILVLCMLIYILLINIENFRKSYRETELVLFFLFFVFWANMTIYKRALLAHGDLVLFQNIPIDIVSESFKNITFLESIYAIGVVPLIFGLITIYFALFVSNSKALMLGASISMGMFILLWFKLIRLDIGLIFLSISLIILSSYSIGKTYERMKMVKLKNAHVYFLLILVIISIGMFIPGVISVKHNTLSGNDAEALLWLRNNTDENAVVLALPEEGSALSYVSGRKNVMDDNYILINNIDARYRDVNSVYSDRFMTSALEKLNYYSVDYIFLSEYNQIKNNMSDLRFYDNSCFEIVYPEIYTERFLDENLETIQINETQDETDEQMTERMARERLNSPNYFLEGTMNTPKIYRVKCKLALKRG